MKIKAFAPASLGNFIIGFDTLGLALANVDGTLLGDVVAIEDSEKFMIKTTGRYAHLLPKDPNSNIIVACREIFHDSLASKNLDKRKFSLHLEKNLPIGSGLGSSATSIVATLIALNTFYGDIFTKKELLQLAGQMEGQISGSIHYDNVAPSLFGGLQLMIPDKQRLSDTLPFFDDWFFIVYYPGISISTRHARDILPKQFNLGDVTIYWQKLASLIHGLYQSDRKLVRLLLKDTLIEPFRTQLVPGFDQARASALAAGALAFGLSGSGPTFFAVSESIEAARNVETAIKQAMPTNAESFSRICSLDQQGGRILGPDEN